ncbi:ATP-binding protein [Streptomyces sp. NPDC002758]
MTDMETTRTAAPAGALVVVESDSPGGVASARDAARAFLDSLDPAPAAETAQTLALVVSELTTNALRHGAGRYTLELVATADAVYLAVSDLNPAPPRERAPDLNGGTGGFGWPMVRRLTSKVSITPDPDGRGKTIHARLPGDTALGKGGRRGSRRAHRPRPRPRRPAARRGTGVQDPRGRGGLRSCLGWIRLLALATVGGQRPR